MKTERRRASIARRLAVELVVVALALAGTGVAAADGAARGERPRKAAQPSIVAQAVVPTIAVYKKAGARTPKLSLSNPTENGGPRVFLVDKQRADGWIRVYLPVRPNHSRGWVRGSDVELATTPYRIEISYSKHRLVVFKGGQRMLRKPVALGEKLTPTPGGKYYLTELYDVPDDSGPYGPFAFALSGFSEKLRQFRGGEAIIGIHGTNRPDSLGRDVSHGCIRIANDSITLLAGAVPLGTPVRINA